MCQALVNAVITEVNQDEVHVELVTGMQGLNQS
ncbi:hypothetical protein P4S68_20160 [Pseudoalteromonas sp. Hal099]